MSQQAHALLAGPITQHQLAVVENQNPHNDEQGVRP